MLPVILYFLLLTSAMAQENNLHPCPNNNLYRAFDGRCVGTQEICLKSQANNAQESWKSELLDFMAQSNKSRDMLLQKLENVETQSNKSRDMLLQKLGNVKSQANNTQATWKSELLAFMAQSNKSSDMVLEKFVNAENKSINELKRTLAQEINELKRTQAYTKNHFSACLALLFILCVIIFITMILEIRFKIITKCCQGKGKDFHESRKKLLLKNQPITLEELTTAFKKNLDQTLEKNFDGIGTEIKTLKETLPTLDNFSNMHKDQLLTNQSIILEKLTTSLSEFKKTLDQTLEKKLGGIGTEVKTLKETLTKLKEDFNNMHKEQLEGIKSGIKEIKEISSKLEKDVNKTSKVKVQRALSESDDFVQENPKQ